MPGGVPLSDIVRGVYSTSEEYENDDEEENDDDESEDEDSDDDDDEEEEEEDDMDSPHGDSIFHDLKMNHFATPAKIRHPFTTSTAKPIMTEDAYQGNNK